MSSKMNRIINNITGMVPDCVKSFSLRSIWPLSSQNKTNIKCNIFLSKEASTSLLNSQPIVIIEPPSNIENQFLPEETALSLPNTRAIIKVEPMTNIQNQFLPIEATSSLSNVQPIIKVEPLTNNQNQSNHQVSRPSKIPTLIRTLKAHPRRKHWKTRNNENRGSIQEIVSYRGFCRHCHHCRQSTPIYNEENDLHWYYNAWPIDNSEGQGRNYDSFLNN